jgi:hypothetical protein
MDRVIAGIAHLNRASAYAALETVFSLLKAGCERLGEVEVSEFVELVHLVLLQFPRGETIRVTGPNQARELDVCLKYNDVYDVALHRTMEFLSRNLADHVDKYSPRQYLRAVLRTLGKEYYRLLVDSYHTYSIPEESAAPSDDEAGPEACAGKSASRNGDALTVAGPEAGSEPDCPGEQAVAQQMFRNWYEGNFSRLELSRLYGLPVDRVERILLKVARSYERGRHLGLVRWLIGMGEDGDVVWLLSKGMSAADVGRKVELNKWVVYKRRDAVRKRLAALHLVGEEGRARRARFLGLAPEERDRHEREDSARVLPG